MESAAHNLLEDERKIHNAVNWNNEFYIKEYGFDPAYKAFSEVMEFRKKVAIRYLDAKNDSDKENLKAILDHCNNQIRNILGV